MSEVEDIQGKKYPGFGRCIYCGSDGGKDGLRDEHIIPKSLGGNTIISEASCARCEAVTSYLDGNLARGIFNEYRAHTGAPSRRKKQRPTEFPARLVVNGVEEVRQFNTSEHPYFLAMPVWGLPTLLIGEPASEGFRHLKAHVHEFIPADLRIALNIPDEVPLQVRGTGNINYAAFARAMAKIAFCHAVMRYGLDGFRHLVVPKLILGTYSCPSHYVGVSLDDPPPAAPKGQLHIINFEAYTLERLKLMVVSIRLFAHSGAEHSGMPIYQVVTGAYRS